MLFNRHAFKSLIQSQIISCRWYYTRNQKSLYAKISPLGNPNVNLAPELDKWVEMGNKVRFAELQRIILDLRKRKRFNQALQVSEWMNSKNIYTITPVQHAVQLDLIGKVHGLLRAESYFNSLSEQDKTEKVYGAILHCYVRQRQTEKALKHLESMEEKGFALSSVAFNDIMSLYTVTSMKYEKWMIYYILQGLAHFICSGFGDLIMGPLRLEEVEESGAQVSLNEESSLRLKEAEESGAQVYLSKTSEPEGFSTEPQVGFASEPEGLSTEPQVGFLTEPEGFPTEPEGFPTEPQVGFPSESEWFSPEPNLHECHYLTESNPPEWMYLNEQNSPEPNPPEWIYLNEEMLGFLMWGPDTENDLESPLIYFNYVFKLPKEYPSVCGPHCLLQIGPTADE